MLSPLHFYPSHSDQIISSLFFGRPILIDCIYANTGARNKPASPENPITQTRQVHLVCASRTVCVATSHVTLTSPTTERLFLDDKFPIGQLFRQMGRPPTFSLLDVSTEVVDGTCELRRTYTLQAEGVLCEILEVFPDREMFVRGETWLKETNNVNATLGNEAVAVHV